MIIKINGNKLECTMEKHYLRDDWGKLICTKKVYIVECPTLKLWKEIPETCEIDGEKYYKSDLNQGIIVRLIQK